MDLVWCLLLYCIEVKHLHVKNREVIDPLERSIFIWSYNYLTLLSWAAPVWCYKPLALSLRKLLRYLLATERCFHRWTFPQQAAWKMRGRSGCWLWTIPTLEGWCQPGSSLVFQLVVFQDPGCGRCTLAPKVDLWASRCRYLWLLGPRRGRVPTKPMYMPTTSSCPKVEWETSPGKAVQCKFWWSNKLWNHAIQCL